MQIATYLSPKLTFLTLFILLGLSPEVNSQTLSFEAMQKLTAEVIDGRCESCHNSYIYDGNWSVSEIDVSDISRGENLKRWESILKSVAMGDMPPAEKKPSAPAPSAPMAPVKDRPRARAEGEKPLASPAVRARARARGVDLARVIGTGPAGRIGRHFPQRFRKRNRMMVAPTPGAPYISF